MLRTERAQAVLEEWYYLTDPETQRRFAAPARMDWQKALERNQWLERQGCRWRWVKAED